MGRAPVMASDLRGSLDGGQIGGRAECTRGRNQSHFGTCTSLVC